MDPVAIYALATDVLAACKDRLDAVLPGPLRFGLATVLNGPPAFDGVDSCIPRLNVWVEAMSPAGAFPAPPVRPIDCNPPAQAIQVVVQTLRCEPAIDVDGFPSPSELDASARAVLVDAQVVWAALSCWALESEDHEVMLVSGTPVPPQGMVVGWETRAIVSLDPCGPCGPDRPFPPGFFASY